MHFCPLSGCAVSDTVLVEVTATYEEVYAPNVFSPNRDGVNDTFILFGPQPVVQGIVQMNIYDRWGGLLYSEKDLLPGDMSRGWRGLGRDQQPASPDTYIYQAEVLFLDGTIRSLSGDILLLR